MAMTKQTTKCDGKTRFRSSVASVSASACSIFDDGIAVSKALNTVADSTFGTNNENSLSCIFAVCTLITIISQFTWFVTLTEPYWECLSSIYFRRRPDY
jgi:hypothetical protein